MSRALMLTMFMLSCGMVSEQAEPVCSLTTCRGCCGPRGECLSCPSRIEAPRPDAAVFDAGHAFDAGVDAGTFAGRDAGSLEDAGADVPDAGVACRSSLRTPVNEAVDAELECDAANAFRSSGGGGRLEVVPGRTGAGLRFTTAAGLFNNEFVSTWTFRVTRAGRHCARAFVRGSASTVTLRLYLGPSGSAAGEQFDLPGPLTSWTRLPPTVPAVSAMAQPGDVGFLVFVDKRGASGTTIEIDDLDVWRSDDGTCRER